MKLKTWNCENKQLKTVSEYMFNKNDATEVEQVLLAFNRLKTLPTNLFENCTKLYLLNLSDNCFVRIPDAIAQAPNLTVISLKNNRIKRIRKNDFKRNLKLKILNFSHNGLNFISDDSFRNLTDLVELDLSFSSISHRLESPIFQSNVSLRILLINDANLKPGDRLFKGLVNLVSLNLNNNNISDRNLNVDIFSDLVSLKRLNLAQNQIRRLRKGLLTNNRKLNNLDLSDNFVERIEAGFFDTNCRLEILSLKCCSPLLNVTCSLFQNNPVLNTLVIGYCVSFPVQEISNLESLSYDSLHLSTAYVPDFIFSSHRNLQSLRINDSFISFDNFDYINTFLTQLVTIHLNGCTIESLCDDIFDGLHNLENLRFVNIRLDCFKYRLLPETNKLVELHLTGCRLRTIANGVFDTFLSLKKLILNRNNFENRLTANIFQKLVCLQTIDLSKSNLDYLPDGLFDSNVNLKTVRLHGNPLDFLDMNMFEKQIRLEYLSLSKQCFLIGSHANSLTINSVRN